MNDPIKQALDRFEIPPEHIDFLFLLPPFYVAKADGKMSIKESMSIAYNSIVLGLVSTQSEEKKAFQTFLKNKLFQFQGKTNLEDLDIVATAINARLEQFPADKAQKIRKLMYETCIKVAEASGPLFRDKVSPEERQMLDKILQNI